MKIKLRKTGEIVKVKGDPPEKAGDRFIGVDLPQPAPEKPAKGKKGCRMIESDGVRAIQCSRGSSATDGEEPPRERSFKFDPKLHEKLKG